MPSDGATAKLDGVTAILDFGEPEIGVRGYAKAIRGIELEFGASSRTRENAVGGDERGVDGGGNHFARVTATDRDFAIDQADAGYAATGNIFRFGRAIIRTTGLAIDGTGGLTGLGCWIRRLRLGGTLSVQSCLSHQDRQRNKANTERGSHEGCPSGPFTMQFVRQMLTRRFDDSCAKMSKHERG